MILIEKIALRLVCRMEEEKLISSSDCEYYQYALITLTERIITIGSMLLIGLLCRQIISTIFFLVFFLSLRKRTGGYHADKFWQCYFGTIITYIAISPIAHFLSDYLKVMYAMLFCSTFIILIIGTVNHPNMDMDREELRESKKAARLLVILEVLVIMAFSMLKVNIIYVSYMSIAVILCASLLCIAKIISQEVQT